MAKPRRSLWGLDAAEADRQLAEQVEPLQRERASVERALALAEAEAGRLTAEIASLADQVQRARDRLNLVRQGVERQRKLAAAQSFAIAREVGALEREQAAYLDRYREQEQALRAEIEERRRSLHRWVLQLLRSLAERSGPPAP